MLRIANLTFSVGCDNIWTIWNNLVSFISAGFFLQRTQCFIDQAIYFGDLDNKYIIQRIISGTLRYIFLYTDFLLDCTLPTWTLKSGNFTQICITHTREDKNTRLNPEYWEDVTSWVTFWGHAHLPRAGRVRVSSLNEFVSGLERKDIMYIQLIILKNTGIVTSLLPWFRQHASFNRSHFGPDVTAHILGWASAID